MIKIEKEKVEKMVRKAIKSFIVEPNEEVYNYIDNKYYILDDSIEAIIEEIGRSFENDENNYEFVYYVEDSYLKPKMRDRGKVLTLCEYSELGEVCNCNK